MGSRHGTFSHTQRRDTDINLGWKNRTCSGSNQSFLDLRPKICTSFYGGSACNSEESPQICFGQVLVRPRSGMETNFLAWTQKSKFCSKHRSRAIPRSIPSSRTLDCALVSPSLTSFRPLRPENEVFFDCGALEFCSVTLAHMFGPSPRVSWRGNLVGD